MLETRHVPFLPTEDAAKLIHGVGPSVHRHREGQLLYPSAGAIATTTERGTWLAPANRISWIPPGAAHGHRAFGETKIRLVEVPRRMCAALPAEPTVFSVTPLLREALLALTGGRSFRPDARERLRRVVIDELTDVPEQPLRLPEPADDRLRAVTDLLHANPADPSTLAELGRTVGASERALSRLFHAELGLWVLVLLWSALAGVGGVIGNLGGGLAVEFGGWRVLFWAGVPIALAAAALIALLVPRQDPHRDPVDGGGALLLTAGSVALLYGIIDGPQDGWGSVQVLGSLALAVALLAAFAWYEARLQHPMLAPSLFRLAGVRTGTLGITVLFFALFGLFYINAQYMQDIKGYSALLTGVAVLPAAVVMPITSARSGRLAARIGARATVVLGLLCVAAGIALLSFATATTPYALYGLLLAFVSGGMGLAMPPLSGMIVHALPPSHAGVGSGLNSTTREFGSALGVAVLSTVLNSRFASHLPAVMRNVPGPAGQEIRQSITAALQYAASNPNPVLRAQLIDGTRDAFTSGTSLGLRLGAALVLLATVVVAHQHPAENDAG